MRVISPPSIRVGDAAVNLTSGFTKSFVAAAVDAIHEAKRLPEKTDKDFFAAVKSIDQCKAAIETLKNERQALSIAKKALQGEDFVAIDHPIADVAHQLAISSRGIRNFNSDHKAASTSHLVPHIERALDVIDNEVDVAKGRLSKLKAESGELLIRCIATEGLNQQHLSKHLHLLPDGWGAKMKKFIDDDSHERPQISTDNEFPTDDYELYANYAKALANRLIDDRAAVAKGQRRANKHVSDGIKNRRLRDEIKELMS